MKGILVILDGLGDLPNKQLNDKTPLEIAETPNLAFLANRGEMGIMYPVRLGFIPGSDEAIISIFNNPQINSSRGQLEARGAGFKLMRGDLALRANFATIDSLDKGNVIDRRAGRTLTSYEAEILAKDLNKKVNLPVKFEFKSTIQHRGVLVFRGGFSEMISNNEISYYNQGKFNERKNILLSRPLNENENAQYTSNVLNEFLAQAYTILENHPINLERKKRGLMPANYILIRGAGIEIPKLKFYRNWLSVAYMPLEIGFSELSGMETFKFEYPKFKKLDVYANLYDGLKQACNFSIKILKKHYKNFDYAYIHFKETDLPGHDNKPFEKKEMLEYVDKIFFKFLRKFAPPNGIKVCVTGDHSTPCKLKAHSADPVPVLLYNNSIPKEKKFCEKDARRGTLGRMTGNELLKVIGFDK